MGTEYVNENVSVKCPALIGKFTARELVNKKVKVDGKIALTQSGAKLTGSGTCKILTAMANGVPQPCQCRMSCTLSGWQNVSNNAAQGSALLLKTSVNQCTVGSPVTISSAGQNNVTKDMRVSVAPLAELGAMAVSSLATETNKPKDSLSPSQEGGNAPSTSGRVASNCQTGGSNPNVNSQKEETEEQKAAFIPRTGLLCACSETNPKCLDCEYRLDRRLHPVVANDAVTLRENYRKAKDKHDRHDRYFDQLFGFYAEGEEKGKSIGEQRGWSTVAHHIISGKQVLEEFPRLVKLARFCGYDVDNDPTSTRGINHYPNCIMLVGYPAGYGKLADGSTPQGKETQEFIKSVDADEVMSESLMQWHVGSHQYRFAKEEKKKLRRKQQEQQEWQAAGSIFKENMQTVLGKRKEFRGQDLTIACYADLLKAHLQVLENTLLATPVCYKDNEKAKQEFIDGMENISRKVKAKLAAFREKPHRSYPYFVSLEAYLYAFAVPRTVHAVLVKRYRHGLRMMPWRITRYADTLRDENKSLSFETEGEPTDLHKLRYDGSSDEEVLRCLNGVCKSSRYFILMDDLTAEDLPFLLESPNGNSGAEYFFQLFVPSGVRSDEDILQEYDSDISAWLRRVAKDNAQQEEGLGIKSVRDARWQKWKRCCQERGESL